MNNLEVELQSFDRVQEYSQLEPEEKPEDGYRGQHERNVESCVGQQKQKVPDDWPQTGFLDRVSRRDDSL